MEANDLKKRLSLVDEESRVALGIDRDDYALCSYFYFRAQDKSQKIAGWCCDPKEDVANFIGVSRVAIYGSLGKMVKKELLEIAENGAVRPTQKWVKVEEKCKETLQKIMGWTVKKLYTDCKETLHGGGKICKVSLHTPYKRYIRKEREQKGQPEGCLVGENLNASTSIKLLDPALPNVEIHDALPTAQTRPTPGPARGETSLGAAKPKASEIAGYTFAEFWEGYGFKRGSKANAQKKWDRLTDAEITAIRDTLEIYKRETVTEDGQRGDKFKPMRKHPEFFLSAKTWEAFAEQAKDEAARPKDEWDEPYQTYVEWVKRKYPTLAKSASYLTKQQYVCHKTEWYVKGMSYIGDHNIQNMLIRAHEALENGVPKASQCGSVFNYQVHLLEERVKSRTV